MSQHPDLAMSGWVRRLLCRLTGQPSTSPPTPTNQAVSHPAVILPRAEQLAEQRPGTVYRRRVLSCPSPITTVPASNRKTPTAPRTAHAVEAPPAVGELFALTPGGELRAVLADLTDGL